MPVMTQQTSGYAAPAGSFSDPSTTDVAREQAAQVGRTTSEAGKRVAGTAADQAGQVAGEARRQARDLLGQARGQATEQARTGQQKASEGLRTLATELHEMADSGDQHGPASDLAKQAADKIGDVAEWLSHREPADLLSEFRAMARRRPGAFLIGAAAAGVLAGRLTRGAVDANRDTSPSPTYAPPAYTPPAYTPAPQGYTAGPGLGAPPVTEPRPYPADVPVGSETWIDPGPAHTAPRPSTAVGTEYGQEFGQPGTPRDDDPLQSGGLR